MTKFFTRNIDWRGRIARAMFGATLIVASLLVSRESRWIYFALVAFGGFSLYEAVRGWCVMRACGMKTKL